MIKSHWNKGRMLRNIERATFFMMIIFAFDVLALAKDCDRAGQYINRKFWLKHPLIFLDKNSFPTVYPNDLIFTHKCGVDAYAGRILTRGTETVIISMRREKTF